MIRGAATDATATLRARSRAILDAKRTHGAVSPGPFRDARTLSVDSTRRRARATAAQHLFPHLEVGLLEVCRETRTIG